MRSTPGTRSGLRRCCAAVAALVCTALTTVGAQAAVAAGASQQVQPVCRDGGTGTLHCFAVVESTTSSGARNGSGGPPRGHGANDIQAAYRLPVTQGSGQTIAIVDAFNDPSAASDLAVYRKTYGLPPCTASSGCFRKLNEQGAAGHYPPFDPGWAVEESLDLDMVSAACPLCHIVLVEASVPSGQDLGAAENTAAGLGVAAISNSFGTQEYNGMQTLGRDFAHGGTTTVVATGDFGFGPASFPAVLRTSLAVGGTTLAKSTNARGWSERAWFAAGSGCSAYVNKPAWQTDNHCFMRTVADVSAVADKLAVYDTSIPPGFGVNPGFIVVGGTSASAPLIAGVVGLAGNGTTITSAYPYQHSAGFFDVVGGSNGYCGGDYLCNGVKGYDAPTGLGTPNGTSGL